MLQQAIMSMLETWKSRCSAQKNRRYKNCNAQVTLHTNWIKITRSTQTSILGCVCLFVWTPHRLQWATKFEQQGSNTMILKLRCGSESPETPDKATETQTLGYFNRPGLNFVFLLVSRWFWSRSNIENSCSNQPNEFAGNCLHLMKLQNPWPEVRRAACQGPLRTCRKTF